MQRTISTRDKRPNWESQYAAPFIVFLLSVLAKDNKLVRNRSQFSVPVCGTFTVFLLSDILQTYSVFANYKRLTQQLHATTATIGDQSKADSADKPRADSGDQK